MNAARAGPVARLRADKCRPICYNWVMASLLDRISIDPNVCFGKPCIRGARIGVSLILDFLASGQSDADILSAWPNLQPEDIRAALAYAAELS